jgi:hypothetical protein
MVRLKDLAASSDGRRCTALRAGVVVVALATCLFVGARPALAGMSCGAQPEPLPPAFAAQVVGDAGHRADVILKAPEGTGLRGLVTAQRREMRAAYPSVEHSLLDQYLLSVTCRTLAQDSALAPSQQFDKYANIYRLLSEPIDKAAPAAE